MANLHFNKFFETQHSRQLYKHDYYPFGMGMPGRKYQAGSTSYRYSINGQEKEKELNENITTALYWEYDSRIGRRWNIDPVIKYYESPYVVFSDNPISFNDPDGDDPAQPKGKGSKVENPVILTT